MKKILYILIFSLTLISPTLVAQTPEVLMDNFFKIYQKNEPIKALDELYSHTPFLERIKDDVEKLKTQFRDLKGLVGEYNSHELLMKKSAKESFVIATYLVKFDRQPIRFTFQFYKPKNEWIIYGFSYDDTFDDDVETAMKNEFIGNIK